MPLNPAPSRQRVINFVSPKVADILFYETKTDDKRADTPAYGTAHPDTHRWPNHKFVFARPADEQGNIYHWFYAAARENQDEYNFEFGAMQIGSLRVDMVTRTYVTLRSSFTPNSPAIGATMPNTPADKFAGTWILYDIDQKRIGDKELDSVFVVQQHTYIQPVTAQGVTYGDIVTKDNTIISVVDEGTAADTGLHIISSTVTPIGNGKAIKVTEQVQGGVWPNPLEVDFGIEPAPPPPVTMWSTLTRKRVTEKVSSIPNTLSLSGDLVGETYKRETPDRVEKASTTQSFDLYTGLQDQAVDRSAYLQTNTSSVLTQDSALPAVGDGSTDLIYRAGDTYIYRRTTKTTSAIPGLKGIDIKSESWGSLVETTNFTTTPDVSDGGSTRLIFKDSQTTVYEKTDISLNISGTTKDKDPQQWGFSIWSGTYADAEDAGADRSKQIWRRGDYRVWLNESVTTEVSGGTKDKNPQRWGTLTWLGTYSEAEDGAADRSRQIWRIGEQRVFLNESLQIEVNGQEVEKNPQQWGDLKWQKNYSTVQNLLADRSSQVWRMGDKTVYLNETATVEPSGTTKDKDPQRFGTLTWTGEYGTSEAAGADRSRQIFRLGNQVVYLNETVELELSGQSIDKNPQPWGFEIWTGGFEETYDGAADRSRQIWKLGDKTVFLNETVEADISGTTKDKDPQQWGEVVWNGTYGDSESGSADRSRQIWRIGNKRVYLNEEATLGISGGTKDINFQEWGELVWTGTYADTSGGDRSRQVYRLGNKQVFLNEEIAIQNVGGSSNSSQPNEWGTLKWLGSYSTSQDLSSGSRSRAVFQAKGLSVYLNETPEVVIDSGEFVSAREENPLLIETQRTSYGTGPTSGTNTRSRVVFSLGGHRVYENITIERQSKGSRTYNAVINVNLPSELQSIDVSTASFRDGSAIYNFNTTMVPGYVGPVTAEVTESWSENPGTEVSATLFRPSAISFWSPVGSIRVPECLHNSINYAITTGTEHPELMYAVYTLNSPATTPPSLQGLNYVARVESQQYSEGFITRVYRVQL